MISIRLFQKAGNDVKKSNFQRMEIVLKDYFEYGGFFLN